MPSPSPLGGEVVPSPAAPAPMESPDTAVSPAVAVLSTLLCASIGLHAATWWRARSRGLAKRVDESSLQARRGAGDDRLWCCCDRLVWGHRTRSRQTPYDPVQSSRPVSMSLASGVHVEFDMSEVQLVDLSPRHLGSDTDSIDADRRPSPALSASSGSAASADEVQTDEHH